MAKCQNCEKEITTLNNLVRNMKPIKDKVLVNCCFTCEKGFYSNSNLQRHFRSKKHDTLVDNLLADNLKAEAQVGIKAFIRD